MRVTAETLKDPVALARGITSMVSVSITLRDTLTPAIERLVDDMRRLEWNILWYRDPGSAWWEQ